MRTLREFVEEVLQEDLEGFIKDMGDTRYFGGSTATASLDPKSLAKSKQVKRFWSKNADHAFMKSLNKVHWFDAQGSAAARLKWFLKGSGKDEISTNAYLPGTKMKALWGQIGVLLDGRVTLAANDMNRLVSGYAADWAETPGGLEKFSSSGVPRRAGFFSSGLAKEYVLDQKSFDPAEVDNNEFIVDNWKVKAVVLAGHYQEYRDARDVINAAKEAGVPLIDQNGNPIDYDTALMGTRSPSVRF